MSTARPSDAAIVRCIEHTLRDVVAPALEGARAGRAPDAYARSVAVQLAGIADHAASRGDNPSDHRREQLRSALATLHANPIVAACVDDDPYAVASAALVASVLRHDADADAVRAVLRPVLSRHLDDELASTTPLVEAFRGRLRHA